MKNIFFKTLLLLLTLCLALGFSACGKDGNDTDDGADNGDGGNAVTPPPADEEDPTELVLIKDGVAKFRVVTASGMDGSTVKASQEFVSTLRELGVTVDDAVRDGVSDKTDCEIIIGYGLKNRDEKYVLDPHDYGDDGYGIMIVDNKVLIAGGNADMTKTAFSYFQSSVMKISSKTKELTDFSIKRDYTKFKYTDYIIPSVEIGGNSLKGYKLVTELEGMPKEHYGYINELADDIYNATGIYLKSASADELKEGENYFALRYVEDAGADGFRAYVDSDLNFIFECSYSNAFSECVKNIVKTQIVDKIGAVTISKSSSA